MKPLMLCCAFRDRLRGPAAVLLLLGVAACSGGKDASEAVRYATVAAAKSRLRISVTEGGALASARPFKVASEMEGKATIIYLVPEGKTVKTGDVIVRMDSADVRDKINAQASLLETARAAVTEASEKHAIQLNQNESDIQAAELELEFAGVDKEKYLRGDYPQEHRRLESEVTIAKEELKRAVDREAWSRRLAEKKFITRTELEADELQAKKAQIDVELAETALAVMDKYEYPKEKRRVEADLVEKGRELERVKRGANAEATKTNADLEAKQRNFALADERLARTKGQLEKSEIRAPGTGVVVYTRQDRGRMGNEPMGEGKQVYEREPILEIPDVKRMLVTVDIHESLVKKIRLGQSALIRLDAMTGREFHGSVTKVSAVPSTSNSWMNPDLKVYPAEVEIAEELDDLRPGMNAQVEMLVADLPDALQVPLQAVQQRGGQAFVYVDQGGAALLRKVELGLNNERSVHITSGLAEGEKVFLTVPAGAPPLPEPVEGLAGAFAAPPPADAAGAGAGAGAGGTAPGGGGAGAGPGGAGATKGAGPMVKPAAPKDP